MFRKKPNIVRNFWKRWLRLYEVGDGWRMEKHVSTLLICEPPPSGALGRAQLAGLANSFFIDLADSITAQRKKLLNECIDCKEKKFATLPICQRCLIKRKKM